MDRRREGRREHAGKTGDRHVAQILSELTRGRSGRIGAESRTRGSFGENRSGDVAEKGVQLWRFRFPKGNSSSKVRAMSDARGGEALPQECACEYFYVASVRCEANRIRLRPESLDGLREHMNGDNGMAIGFLLEVGRTLGEMGFIASREGVAQQELRVEDAMKVLSGEQTLPWSPGPKAAANPELRTMFCCEGHGNPYYCTAPR
jgi:hypothetical protein